MGDNGLRQDLGIVIQSHFHRCSNCGAFLTPDNGLKRASLDGDCDTELYVCDGCMLAQPGSDELV